MAVLTLAQFQDRLKINGYTLALDENLVQSKTQAGHVISSSIGPRLWQGTISTTQHNIAVSSEAQALIGRIQTAGNYFEFSPPSNRFPQADPTGSKLGSAVPKITTSIAGFTINVSGLPNGYILTVGDYFSYQDTLGIHRLHQIAETKTATTGGTITGLALVNPILAGSVPAANTNLTFIRPKLTAQYVAGSGKVGSFGRVTGDGTTFNFIQAIRIT